LAFVFNPAGGSPAGNGMWERLTVVETESALLVADADDPDDWVVAFAKNDEFPARTWAERMTALYNSGVRRPYPQLSDWAQKQK
jgi:hypothetical protein